MRWIPYELATEAEVTVRIYNLKGQLIRVLLMGSQPAGSYLTKGRAAYWNGRNNVGQKVSSGLYFYTIQAGNFTATKRMILVK
jgi:flagellar hook assembly protein FlgD